MSDKPQLKGPEGVRTICAMPTIEERASAVIGTTLSRLQRIATLYVMGSDHKFCAQMARFAFEQGLAMLDADAERAVTIHEAGKALVNATKNGQIPAEEVSQ